MLPALLDPSFPLIPYEVFESLQTATRVPCIFLILGETTFLEKSFLEPEKSFLIKNQKIHSYADGYRHLKGQ